MRSAPVPGSVDTPELLDIDVHELARPAAFVAAVGLQPESAQAPHPDPGQDPRDGLLGHPRALGDLGAGQPQPPQRGDRLQPALASAIPDTMRCRGPIEQPGLPPFAIAARPTSRQCARSPGGPAASLSDQPSCDDPQCQSPPPIQTESGVSVDLHPVTSLGLSGVRHLSASKEARMNNVVRFYT